MRREKNDMGSCSRTGEVPLRGLDDGHIEVCVIVLPILHVCEYVVFCIMKYSTKYFKI